MGTAIASKKFVGGAGAIGRQGDILQVEKDLVANLEVMVAAIGIRRGNLAVLSHGKRFLG